MRIDLAYGRGHLPVEFPDGRTTLITPAHVPGLPDEQAAVRRALDAPVAAAPLREWLRPHSRICILFTDITRATPNDRLIPWLLEYLSDNGVRREQILLLNQLGTHRPNTRAELEQMLTPEVLRNYEVRNHEPENPAALVEVGRTRDGAPALLNRLVVEADVRIVTGFIEPHFFAGFSGGPKGIMPGVAGLETVMSNHGMRHINDPRSSFGITTGNPLWEEIRDIALGAGRSFLVNVTLNETRAITGVFAGDLIAAHQQGCEFVRQSAMQACREPFEVVVTTNSGYPLDQNLYQGVKGMAAGARVLKPGGTLILACECSDGVPTGSSYERMLHAASEPAAVLSSLDPLHARPEQWQAQIQALVQQKARVLLHSSLPEATVLRALLEPCPDIGAEVRRLTAGNQAAVAVLPYGPLTVPYLA